MNNKETHINLIISELRSKDHYPVLQFISTTVKDTFEKEKINDEESLNEVIHEIEGNIEGLFKQSQGKDFYLIAKVNSQIVGLIGIGIPNQIILNHSLINPREILEIKNVYVHPDFQKQGVGMRMFEKMLRELKRRNQDSFCLDCGYSRSQIYWKKLLGNPDVILPNYWENEADHWIWLKRTNFILSKLNSR